jgi:AcrR family transcriptional regulator
MKSASRRARRAQATRDEIIEAARRVFRRVGLQGATMREIASEADYAVGALYRYFPSKTALVNGAADEVALRALRAFERPPAEGEPFDTYLRDRLIEHFEIFLEDRMLIEAFARMRPEEGDGEVGVSPEVSRSFMGAYRNVIELGIARGALHVADVRVAAFALQGAFRSGFFLYCDSAEPDRPAVAQGFLDFVFKGMGGQAPAANAETLPFIPKSGGYSL